MTIKELLEMEIHEEYVFFHSLERCLRIVIRVPGGWIYETEAYKDGVMGGMTSCFVPEPSLQAIEPDIQEPDYDKTFQSEKDFLTMGRFS